MAVSPIPPHLAPTSAAQTTPRPPRTARPVPQGSPAQSVPSPRQGHGSPVASSPRGQTSGVMDVEAVLRSNGGDVDKALEQVVAERNTLQQQNSQLWKLIEKQRAQCAHLVHDNERLRADRERANAHLAAAGMEPVNGKRLPHSSSAVGLGLRADGPSSASAIKRNNSDRDERIVAGASSSLPVPSADSSATSSPSEPAPALLPSPMADRDRVERKSNRESRMAFAPEVRSFLSLAESPRVPAPPDQAVPARRVPSPTPQPVLTPTVEVSDSSSSPGSTYSPSPAAVKRDRLNGGQADSVDGQVSTQYFTTITDILEEPAGDPDEGREPAGEEVQRDSPLPQRKSSLSRRMGVERDHRLNTEKEPVDSTTSAPETPNMLRSTPRVHQASGFPPAPPAPDARSSVDSQRYSNETTPRQSVDHRGAATRSSFDTAPSGQASSSTSSQYRPLPRLSAALLPHTRLAIPHTTVHPNSVGRDVLCFIVTATVRPPNAAPLTWNVAKLFSAFIDLDSKVRAKSGKRSKEWKSLVAPLPDGKAWKDFAPSKIDQRKTALEAYIQSLLVAPISDKSDLCDFLSTDPVQARISSSKKEGYLTKKGKSFGGWRTRYFVLDGSILECYENRGGPHNSSIVITNAQIGRQNRASESAEDRESRHAFLIIEQSKKGPQRHILCAESDVERDSWIDALVKHVDGDVALSRSAVTSPPPALPPAQVPLQPPPISSSTSHPHPIGHAAVTRKRSNSRKSSRDVVVTNAQPLSAMPSGNSKFAGAPSPSLINSLENQKQGAIERGSTSFPSSLASQQPSGAPSTSPLPPSSSTMPYPDPSTEGPPVSSRQSKRQSMIPTRTSTSSHSLGPPPSHSAAYLSKLSSEGLNAPPGLQPASHDKDRERKAKSGRFWPSFGKSPAGSSSSNTIARPVFGVPLPESLAIASVANLPAIVFRCIQWLEAKHAEEEEGIYRLSGSSAVIKGLKDRFDADGDVNLLVLDEHWDPHAIAGLLKSFLRELPTSLLTRDLHPRFLAVMDLIDSSARVSELSRLVGDLPPPNYALLRALTAHLILIVKHAQANKMTLRNIGIVFSPTLGIPAGIFSELVSHFGAIFDDERPEDVGGEGSVAAESNSEALDGGPSEDGHGQTGDETVGRKRNSMLYQQGGADALLGLGGRALDPVDDSASDISVDDAPPSPDPESDVLSALSSENLSVTSHGLPPRANQYPHPASASRTHA